VVRLENEPLMTNKASFNLDAFKGAIGLNSVVWQDRYEIKISPPACLTGTSYDDTTLANLYADHVGFPQIMINNKRFQAFGPSAPRPMSIDYGGEGLPITFILDGSMAIKSMFDYWMQCVIDPDNYSVAYQDSYTCHIEIRQLDKNNNIIYTCEMEDAYPFVQSAVEMGNSMTNQASHLTVGFAYRKWKNLGLPDHGSNAVQAERTAAVTVNQIAANNGISSNDANSIAGKS
jgi:hypothetical protein